MDMKVDHCICNIPSLVPTVCQMNSIHTLPSYFCKTWVLSTHLYTSGIFPSRFPVRSRNFTSTPCAPHMHLSHPPWFDHPNSMCSGVQIMKPLIMQLYPASCSFHLGTKWLPHHPIQDTLNLCSYKNYIPIKYTFIHTHMYTCKFRWEEAQFLMIRGFSNFCKCSENHCWSFSNLNT